MNNHGKRQRQLAYVAVIPRQEFGGMLWQLADLVRVADSRRSFRSKAFRRAVWSLDHLSIDLSDSSDAMQSVPGIGPGTTRLIEEYNRTGHLAELEELHNLYPADAFAMARLPRMTPAILRRLKEELGVETVPDLLSADTEDRLLSLKGVGPASSDLWQRILTDRPAGEFFPAHQASVFAFTMADHISRHLGTGCHVTGQVRRGEEWIDRIDLVVEAPDRATVVEFLKTSATLANARSTRVIIDGESHSGLSARFTLAEPGSPGVEILTTTGPEEHVLTVLAKPPAGAFPTEGAVYAATRQTWLPPGARDLPTYIAEDVVRLEDIKGDLHVHSHRSPDGRMSLESILAVAEKSRFDYVLITDHTLGLRFGGLTPEELRIQAGEIEAVRGLFPRITVFHGAEVNIEENGDLDLDDETLRALDLVVAGLHSHFRLGERDQTARLLKAMSHPKVGVLAHPTGRRIGIRPPIDLDIDAIIEGSLENDVALELNGHRDRLDLSQSLAERALRAGALLAANSDAHRVAEMGNMGNAVTSMQRAGVGPSAVINTRDHNQFREWVGLHE